MSLHLLAPLLALAIAPPAPPAAPAAASTTTSAPTSGPASAPPAEDKRALRLAVYELKADGFDARTARVVTDALVAEVRKLQRVSVVAMDEIQAMLDHEANKQLTGCVDESCLAEIADSLGVDGLVIGSIARIGDDSVIGIKRIDQKSGGVVGAGSRRLEGADGEQLLAAVGPLVAELFPGIPLRAGARRGVDDAITLRLHPPPLPTGVFWTDAGLSGALAVAGAAAVVLNRVAVADHDAFVAATLETGVPVRGVDVRAKQGTIAATAVASWTLLGTAAVGALALAALSPFTDWDHLADEQASPEGR